VFGRIQIPPQSGYGQAKLDLGITVAYSIKIPLRIFGMHGGDPTSTAASTCGACVFLFADQTLRASSNYLRMLRREAAMKLLVPYFGVFVSDLFLRVVVMDIVRY
jgi:hypothetical protein